MLEDARSLERRLSASDRRRFGEYLSCVHEIEGRIKQAGKEQAAGGWKPTLAAPDQERPADGIPAELPVLLLGGAGAGSRAAARSTT